MKLSVSCTSTLLTALLFSIGAHPALAAPPVPREGFMSYSTARKGKALEINLNLKATTGGGYAPGFDRTRVATVQGLTPRGKVDTMRYDRRGSTANVGAHNDGHGAGFVAAVAAKDRGIVLVDVRAGRFVSGKAPAERELLSLSKLLKTPAIKAAAVRAGLDPKTLTLKVSNTKLSAGFKSKDLTTLGFTASLSDATGKRHSAEFSTILSGNLAAGLDKISLGRLEHGLSSSWGWLYPPSALK